MTSAQSAAVGQRVSIGPHRGTVRYHGPVASAEGDWLGIEWDDPGRGKHDGTSADGTRHFEVRVPGSGSFVRFHSSKLSHGCSFIQALQHKYTTSQKPVIMIEPNNGQAKHSRRNLAEIEIETPNMQGVIQRASRLDRLREVGLGRSKDSLDAADANEDVSFAFDATAGETEGSIRKTCPNLRWLDLSRSLLPDWHQVSLISAELDKLQTLLLHFTRLSLPIESVPYNWSERFASIHDLRLDGTMATWADILHLAPAFGNLQYLQLGSNQIAELCVGDEHKESFLPSLTSLSLEDNLLSSWIDVTAALSRLPALECLNLTSNRMCDIPVAASISPKLKSLKELYLINNSIATWTSLENIDTWISDRLFQEGLERLHIAMVEQDDSTPQPLLDKYEYRDFRAIAIARLPSLLELDHTAVLSKERKDAELFVYSRLKSTDSSILFGTDGKQGERATLVMAWQEKVAMFPRLPYLVKQFDGNVPDNLPDQTQEADGQQQKGKGTLRSKLITLRLYKSSTAPVSTPPHLAHACFADVQQLQILASTPFRLAKLKFAKAVSIRPNQITSIWVMLTENQTANALATTTMKVNSKDSGSMQKREESSIVLEIDDLSRDLDWYEVGQGDSLILVTAD